MEGISSKKLLGKTIDIGDEILIKVNYATKKWSNSIYHPDGSISAPVKSIYFGEVPYSLYRLTCGDKIL